jgi:hypothetical protein
MEFEEAFSNLRKGKKIARKSWGKDKWLFYDPLHLMDIYARNFLYGPQDMFADDWEVIE